LPIRAIDVPQPTSDGAQYPELRQTVFSLNPDYLVAQEKVRQNSVRLGYAHNQRLPELDVKGSYGLNGLGDSPRASWSDIEHQSEPAWYLGIEFRIPLGGGIRSRNDLMAARLELQSAELALRGLHTEILNSLNSAWSKVQTTRGSVANYQSAVKYNLSLLQAALARLEAGKLESRKALEIEADLLEAKVSVVEALVHFQVASLELDVIHGGLLQRRHLELTQGELEMATLHLGGARSLGDAQYQQGLDEIGRLHWRHGLDSPTRTSSEPSVPVPSQDDPRFSPLPLEPAPAAPPGPPEKPK
jgi:outer membrane protein TolC